MTSFQVGQPIEKKRKRSTTMPEGLLTMFKRRLCYSTVLTDTEEDVVLASSAFLATVIGNKLEQPF
jgi:hypothetical protein